jgi:hypothetical protein
MATRREVDQLRDDIHRIDEGGTRGVGVLQTQMINLTADLAELKAQVSTRFEAHQRVHDQDHADRVNGRRWLIGTGIAGIMAMIAAITLLVDIARHVHG